jgi:hypothetical protein
MRLVQQVLTISDGDVLVAAKVQALARRLAEAL